MKWNLCHLSSAWWHVARIFTAGVFSPRMIYPRTPWLESTWVRLCISALQTSVRKVTRRLWFVAATIVDATMIGCMACFMNHCCQPNAYAKVINVDTGQGPNKKIVVFANRNIVTSFPSRMAAYDDALPVHQTVLATWINMNVIIIKSF